MRIEISGPKNWIYPVMLLWQQFFFRTTLMAQAITTPSLSLFWSTADFIKILKASFFPIDYIAVGRTFQPQCNTYGETLIWRFLIKSIINQKIFKLDMVIPWTISIVQNKEINKNSVAIATCLEEFIFFAPITQLLFIQVEWTSHSSWVLCQKIQWWRCDDCSWDSGGISNSTVRYGIACSYHT